MHYKRLAAIGHFVVQAPGVFAFDPDRDHKDQDYEGEPQEDLQQDIAGEEALDVVVEDDRAGGHPHQRAQDKCFRPATGDRSSGCAPLPARKRGSESTAAVRTCAKRPNSTHAAVPADGNLI